jgi:hypothetical protein
MYSEVLSQSGTQRKRCFGSTFLLDILSLSWSCTSGDFAGEEGHLPGQSARVLRYMSRWVAMAIEGDGRGMTYEFAYATAREATVAAELAFTY